MNTMTLMCGACSASTRPRLDGLEDEAVLRVGAGALAAEAGEHPVAAGLARPWRSGLAHRPARSRPGVVDRRRLRRRAPGRRCGCARRPVSSAIGRWRCWRRDSRIAPASARRRRTGRRSGMGSVSACQRSIGVSWARAARCRSRSRAHKPSSVTSSENRRHQPVARALRHGQEDRVEGSSGSPGKNIWVTRREAMLLPNSEKWMWLGRQALAWLPQG
jgi:hypothetical protein